MHLAVFPLAQHCISTEPILCPLLLFGYDIIIPMSTEITHLEHSQLSVLRIILYRPPTHAPNIAIHALGTLPVHHLLYVKHLSFFDSILTLPDTATPRIVYISI